MDPSDLAHHGLSFIGPGQATGLLLDGDGSPLHCLGYPGPVSGYIHTIDGDGRDDVLRSLDLQHGARQGGLRRTIAKVGGDLVWAFHWTGDMTLPVVPDGDWQAYRHPRLI